MKTLITGLALCIAPLLSFSQDPIDLFKDALIYSIHLSDSNHMAGRKILLKGGFEYDVNNSDRNTQVFTSKKETQANCSKHIIVDKKENRIGIFVMGDFKFNTRLKSHLKSFPFIEQAGQNFTVTAESGYKQNVIFDEFVWLELPSKSDKDWSQHFAKVLKVE